MAESLWGWIVERLFGAEIDRRVNLATSVLDDVRDLVWSASGSRPRDRLPADREEVLRDALEAWRLNPLARRIVELTSQYVVGGGLSVESKHERTNRFLQEWWNHRLNRMSIRVFELCDELTRSGELFLVLSTDAAGMTYVRAVPAIDILEVETAPNDIEQELVIWEKPDPAQPYAAGGSSPSMLRGRGWPVYDLATDGRDEAGNYPAVMVHYAINRPVGATRGESDLAPILKWIARYSSWLEDRVRLNRFRQSFVYVVTGQFRSAAERLQRQAEINANPPAPGSVLVTDETEKWEVINPELDSFEAGADGLAIKKMISAGSGNPLHFLAEPESATRTTAESSGGPTFRHYEQRQLHFLWMVEDLVRIALRRRKQVDRLVNPEAELLLKGGDISARDNTSLAAAARSAVDAFGELRNRGLIDDAELLRVAYRFAGEVVDVEAMLKRGAAEPLKAAPTAPEVKPKGEGQEPAEPEDQAAPEDQAREEG